MERPPVDVTSATLRLFEPVRWRPQLAWCSVVGGLLATFGIIGLFAFVNSRASLGFLTYAASLAAFGVGVLLVVVTFTPRDGVVRSRLLLMLAQIARMGAFGFPRFLVGVIVLVGALIFAQNTYEFAERDIETGRILWGVVLGGALAVTLQMWSGLFAYPGRLAQLRHSAMSWLIHVECGESVSLSDATDLVAKLESGVVGPLGRLGVVDPVLANAAISFYAATEDVACLQPICRRASRTLRWWPQRESADGNPFGSISPLDRVRIWNLLASTRERRDVAASVSEWLRQMSVAGHPTSLPEALAVESTQTRWVDHKMR